MTIYKLLAAFILALALSGCSSKPWDWFFGDDEEEDIVYEEEMVDDEMTEDEMIEEDEEVVYEYVYEDEYEDRRRPARKKRRRLQYEDEEPRYGDEPYYEEDDMPPPRRRGQRYSREMERDMSRDMPPEDSIIRFGYKQTELTDRNMTLLEEHAAYLQNNPDAVVTVEGHTDSVASADYNKKLGLRRAKMVAGFLEDRGVDPEQIVTISYGEERPLRSGDSERAHAMNRRVELAY